MTRLAASHVCCSFDPAETSQYKELLENLDEEAGDGPRMVDEDEDLQMEKGDDVAPNRVCPLSMIEVCSHPRSS